jgi:hypothetical protein
VPNGIEAKQKIRDEAGERTVLRWEPSQCNGMAQRTEEALNTVPGRWQVLNFCGNPCRIAVKSPQHFHPVDNPDAKAPAIPILEPYNKEGMLLRIEQSVAFYEEKEGHPTPIPVSDKLVNLVLKNPESSLPATIGLVSHPLVLPTGELLIEEGLHSGSGISVHFGGTSFEEPGSMTPSDGIGILRTEMLGEFHFASEADEAAAFALVLTPIVRKMLDIAPGYVINASTQGSGKTTLARMTHLLITGQDMPVAAMLESGTEDNKVLTAMLSASVPMVCFDNLTDGSMVKSPILSRMLTSSYVARPQT